MLLDSPSTYFLCLDSGWWLVIITTVLVVVTGGLWIAALCTLKEQRRVTALLNKPHLIIENPQIKWFQTLDGRKYGIDFIIRNVGDGSAWNVHVAMRATLVGIDLNYENTYDESFIGRNDFFTVQLPAKDFEKAGKTPEVRMLVEITFDDISTKHNKMNYIAHQFPVTGAWAITR